MEPEDPMHHFANLDPKPGHNASSFRRRLLFVLMGLGTAACLAILFCAPYNLTEIRDGEVRACTMYAVTLSLPPPRVFLGHFLARNQYWFELAFGIILTILTFWTLKPSRQRIEKEFLGAREQLLGEMGCLIFFWVMLLGGVIIIGLSVLFSNYHHPIWCEDPGGGD